MPWKHFLACSTLLALCACTTPLPGLAKTDVPKSFEQKAAQNAPVWPAIDWWRGFQSNELDRIVDMAQQGNLDLAAAEARVMEADAQARSAGSVLLPNFSLGAGVSHSVARNAAGRKTSANSIDLSLGASYEVDFWGRNQAAVAAAQDTAKATLADRQTVALTITAGAADAYFQILSSRDRLAIAQANLQNAEAVYDITEARVQNGAASPLEMAQQLATLAGQRAAIPPLQQSELSARAELATLLGLAPEGFDVRAQNLDAIAAPTVAPGLPSELLVRRPDIVSAEASLRAANADVTVARTALFPAVDLTGSGGVASSILSGLFDNGYNTNVGAALAQTIFDAGRLQAQTDVARGRQQEVLVNYRNTVINAFADVETALGDVAHLAQQQDLRAEQVNQLQTAFDIAQARYREGVDDYLTVLNAQQSLFSARDQYGQIKLARLEAVVALYTALGGGWRDPVAPAMAQATAPTAP